ncbi:putative lipid II flippase FtsW [Candidatus Uhrbacteria bacterium]|nr:putative lipid II flippase FtsW [Candidatus Uhrbacteria bacterium]
MREADSIQPVDYPFLAIVGTLVAFGFVMLASASGPTSYANFGQDSFYLVKHQLFFGLVPGLIGLYLASRIPYTFWKKRAWEFLLISIGLLVLVFIPGLASEFGTSRSWISIGGAFSLQPAEIVKLTFLFYLAAWLERRGSHGVKTVESGLIPFLSVLGTIMLLMVLQPDVGTMSIIIATALVVYFVAGAPLLHIGGFVAAGVGLFTLLIVTSQYRYNRLMTLLNPEFDPQGVGYHINQALLALGSGGFFGLGYGESRQKFQYLPEVVGDSIFAVIGEEMGFVVAALLIAGFLLLFWRALRIANASPDPFGKYVVIGIASWFLIQGFVNIGSMVGLLPITGVTLPFMSYGGTSLAVSLGAVGVILNISRYGKKTSARR